MHADLSHVAKKRLLIHGSFWTTALHQPGNVLPPADQMLHFCKEAVPCTCKLTSLIQPEIASLL